MELVMGKREKHIDGLTPKSGDIEMVGKKDQAEKGEIKKHEYKE